MLPTKQEACDDDDRTFPNKPEGTMAATLATPTPDIRHARTLGIASVWIVLSASLVFLNKFILTRSAFRFPLTLALLHMLSCSVFCSGIFWLCPRRKSAHFDDGYASPHALGLCGVAALFAVSLTCANAALRALDVATVQTLKALNPILIYLAGAIVGLNKPSLQVATAIVAICIGILLSVRGSPEFHAVGLALQIASIVTDSARYLMLQAYMQSNQLELDALNVLYMVAPAATVLLWVPASLWEFPSLFDSLGGRDSSSSSTSAPSSSYAATALPLVGVSCCIACCLNLASNAFIRATSALTMSVSGVIKDALMISLSLASAGVSRTPVECAGFAMTLLASSAYNAISIKDRRNK